MKNLFNGLIHSPCKQCIKTNLLPMDKIAPFQVFGVDTFCVEWPHTSPLIFHALILSSGRLSHKVYLSRIIFLKTDPINQNCVTTHCFNL